MKTKILTLLKFILSIAIIFAFMDHIRSIRNGTNYNEFYNWSWLMITLLYIYVFICESLNNIKQKTRDEVILNLSDAIKDILGVIDDIIDDINGITKREVINIDKDKIFEYTFKYNENFKFTVQDILNITRAKGGAKLSNGELEIRYSDKSKLLNNFSKFTFKFNELDHDIILEGEELCSFIDNLLDFLRNNNNNQ